MLSISTPATDPDEVEARLAPDVRGGGLSQAGRFARSSRAGRSRDRRSRHSTSTASRSSHGSSPASLQLLESIDTVSSADSPIALGADGRVAGWPRSRTRAASFANETAAVRRAIDDAGDVVDSASPALRDIRDSLRRQRTKLRSTLDTLTRGRDTAKYLQDQIVTDRNGRYVVVVRAEHRDAIPGHRPRRVHERRERVPRAVVDGLAQQRDRHAGRA